MRHISEHSGRTIGITPLPIGSKWTALVEIWLQGNPHTHAGHLMPFSARFDSESAAVHEALETARRYIDVHRLGADDVP